MTVPSESRADEIIEVVIDLLDSGGYDAVQVRTVASRARVSLTTIYKLYGTLDQLTATALERWMETHAYAELDMPYPDESPYDILVRVLRTVFEPWERHPRMLEAHYRLQGSSVGEWLFNQGVEIVRPLTEAALRTADPAFVGDLELIYSHFLRGVLARFADGEIKVAEILPILERGLRRLITDSQIQSARTQTPRSRRQVKSTSAEPRQPTSDRRPRSA